MKISRFCWGVELKTAAKFLAIYGLVVSIIGVIGAAIIFALPFLLGLPNNPAFMGFYVSAVLLLILNIGWFIFSHRLLKKNSNNDVPGVKKLIKFGSYIIGSVQAVSFSLIFISGTFLLTFLLFMGSGKMALGSIFAAVGGFLLIFPSLLLHGIRTKSSGKIKAWIIFKFVSVGLILSLGLLSSILTGKLTSNFFGTIACILAFMYSSGMVIVHYNIVLDDENILESALESFEANKTHMNTKVSDYPPPYSQLV